MKEGSADSNTAAKRILTQNIAQHKIILKSYCFIKTRMRNMRRIMIILESGYFINRIIFAFH